MTGRLPGQTTSPDQKAAVFIPSYWDPQRTAEKPDLTDLKAIRFITGDDYPPFNFSLPDGTVAGFNVDLARAICSELQLTCTIQARSWHTILSSLKNNEGDAAIASLSITGQAHPDVDFTSAYYRTPARFVTRLPATLENALPETLGEKRVGVQVGTAHEAYLSTFFPRALLKTYPTADAARAALKAGEIDVLFADAIGSALWLDGTDAAGCCAFLGGPYTESRFFGQGAGIAVRKGDIVMRQALDNALRRLAAEGVYTELYLKHFPISFY